MFLSSNSRTLSRIVTVVTFGICNVALAQPNAAYDHVVKVQANKNKYLYVAVAGNFSSVHGCRTPWWARSLNTVDDAQTKAMMQISLSSLLSRSPVHVYTEGCDSAGYPILTQLQIQEREPPPPPPPPPPPCTAGRGEQCCRSDQRCCGSLVNGRCQGQCVGRTQSCP